jgi:all-trans-nonaprenyl-diphosphate synthase
MVVVQTNSSDLSAVLEPISQDMAVLTQRLSSNLIDDNPFIDELLDQVFRAGGKRIRPGLVLLCHRATCKEDSNSTDAVEQQLHITLAALTELIHTASLVHDDVIDRADVRRGQTTVHTQWSEKIAVLLGDLLFAQASVCLSQLESPQIVGIYGRVLGDLCAGEIRQMRQQYSLDVNWESYIHKSYCKTASLFSAGCRSAAILNNCSAEIIQQLAEYGKNLGICFQITDDLLDVTGNSDVLGKKTGGDLAQGIITAPALAVLERKDEPANKLAHLINTRAVNSTEGLEEALDLIQRYGGVEDTRALCRKYASQAKDNLKVIPNSSYRDSLDGAIEYLLHRVS